MWHLSSGHGLRRSDPPVRVVALARSPQQHLCMMMMMMMMMAARMMRLGHGLDSFQDWMRLWMRLNLWRRNQRRAEAQER
jgi:fumarate reductase subunit D